mmetsp:Transcript_8023/g.13997  ORF Transcript_8023/g.13997 Transcript_8023/m.13997 type:complete len:120 (+) Transcript_8023:1109-1468(+)
MAVEIGQSPAMSRKVSGVHRDVFSSARGFHLTIVGSFLMTSSTDLFGEMLQQELLEVATTRHLRLAKYRSRKSLRITSIIPCTVTRLSTAPCMNIAQQCCTMIELSRNSDILAKSEFMF